ncbi:hypothetical protein Nepgr_013222 [Nepenthes gracilis]|uniref:Protein kinase domain-containing protein n=1 Tax=Nepenthes gracilis TaxID=150966 RepID=A0AAD3SJ43_NEPGR|nr:hypothetical protein Nepgr_013222 [Nepenthes gracilis]
MKVSRGSSARNILVCEVKQCDSATLVVGTSKTYYTIQSPASVAKYYARKLLHSFSVFAVDNGKIVLRKEATPTSITSWDSFVCESDQETHNSLVTYGTNAWKSTLIKKYFGYFGCTHPSPWKGYSSNQFAEESNDDSGENSPLPLVPFQKPSTSSGDLRTIGRRWPFLRWKRVFSSKSLTRKKIPCSISKQPMRHSSMAIHPDEKHDDNSAQKDDELLGTNGENGAIVPVGCISAFKELEHFLEKYSTCRLFTYQELLLATCNFQAERMVGKGGSSQVFRGSFPNKKELAVKILKPSGDVLKEFLAEIEIVTDINHKNIISLMGFCFEDNNLALVYDLLSRGSLEENLHGNKKDAIDFGWEMRYKVAMGVAEALNHLHNGSPQPVIHRDVKSSNILLSDEFEPQLADFGLASWASSAASYTVCTDVAGTFGYLAPEYFMHGKVTEKIDVYAFGVVLLELLSSRKPIDDRNPKGRESLVMWASPVLMEGKVSQLLDPTLGDDYDRNHIERMVLAATLCIKRAPQCRPPISIILKLLQGDIEVTKWAKQQVNSTTKSVVDDIQSHLNVAFLDADIHSVSSSTEQNVSMEEYLKGRCSCSPGFY